MTVSEASEAARNYDVGIRYLSAARRITAATRRLDDEDARAARKLSDRFTDKGLALLTSVMRPARARPAQEG
ncbi:hypothetical protein LRS10_09540 [Phenylobacterium sp. J426]|uniref:hypothetical protein n=1 Tax=Phenylobacterium sp. J426 TaxID=2898439 RepID=UPI0021518613|nr:hypothetical protein [Phenylobacterium sp. J426]MCR5874385.1 hypothetical protein [Phenylobacterium sp. J426]